LAHEAFPDSDLHLRAFRYSDAEALRQCRMVGVCVCLPSCASTTIGWASAYESGFWLYAYSVLTAEDGRTGLSLLTQHRVNAVVLDYRMPGMTVLSQEGRESIILPPQHEHRIGEERQVRVMKGKVKWFNAAKGYGFIGREDGPDVFVHHSAIQAEGYRDLKEDEEVEFEIEQGAKGPQAVRVVPVRERRAS